MTTAPPTDVLAAPEFVAALRAFSPGEKIWLRRKGEAFCPGTGMEPEDLLQEAICRTLEHNGRNCPREVDPATFLGNAMRSIASAEREKRSREILVGAGNDDANPLAQATDPAPSPERAALDRVELSRVVGRIEELFNDDPQALAVVLGDMAGWSADEICQLEPMNQKQFAAARKRRRRAIQREFSKGSK